MNKSHWNKSLIKVLTGIFENGDASFGETDFLREVASENILDGNKHHALNQIKEHIYSSFSSSTLPVSDFNGVRFYDISKSENLDYIIEAIKNHSITIGEVNFNDVHDPLIVVFGRLMKDITNIKFERKWFDLLNEALNNLRIACLCPSVINKGLGVRKFLAIQNELMWAHYANNHTGICVEYEFSKVDFEKINNLRNGKMCFIAPVEYSNETINLENLTMHEALFKKSNIWKYEHEHRIIYYDWKRDTKYVPISATIKAVYLGVAIDNKNSKRILKELKGTNILVYRMVFNSNDLLNLRYVRKQ